MKRMMILVVMIVLMAAVLPTPSRAEDENLFYLTGNGNGSTVNTGMDNGFSMASAHTPGEGDVHFGWTLGRFYLKGYTDMVMENGTPVFLVNAGDNPSLGYALLQDTNQLNGKDGVRINHDTNGFDAEFGIERTDFGFGALFVRMTDHQNLSRVVPYLDYLSALHFGKGNTVISSLEEGDYEVALDYEVASAALGFIPHYDNYRTFCKFKVRNGNAMVFLRDEESKSELPNCAVAESGFILDYANSHYLSVLMEREILTENSISADGSSHYSLTTRSNRPASDGRHYTNEGIYHITVRNVYTNAETRMVVSVGTNPIYNAYVTSGCAYSLEEIQNLVNSGEATISDDWRIEMTPVATQAPETVVEETINNQQALPQVHENSDTYLKIIAWGVMVAIILVMVIGIVWLVHWVANCRKKNRKDSSNPDHEDADM